LEICDGAAAAQSLCRKYRILWAISQAQTKIGISAVPSMIKNFPVPQTKSSIPRLTGRQALACPVTFGRLSYQLSRVFAEMPSKRKISSIIIDFRSVKDVAQFSKGAGLALF